MVPEPRVLVVEDEFLLRADLVDGLRARGLSVVEAPNGMMGWAVYLATSIDVVLTDIRMPGEIDGVELAKRIRSVDPGAKIIAVSGSTSDIPPELMDAVFDKPVDYRHLHETVLRLLATAGPVST